jgi:hypothetical protein
MRRQPKPLPWWNLISATSNAGRWLCRSGTSAVTGGKTTEVARVADQGGAAGWRKWTEQLRDAAAPACAAALRP